MPLRYRWRARPAILVTLLGVAACAASHTRDEDAGADGRVDGPIPRIDSGADAVVTIDVAAVDVAPIETDSGDPCISSLGWRRCTPECRTCPSGHCCPTGFECHAPSGTCFPGRGFDPCRLARSPTRDREPSPPSCPDAKACFFPGSELPGVEQSGLCVPAELCLLSELEAGPHRCFWGDGEEVIRLPDTGCPDEPGRCGRGSGCPYCAEPCAGVSNERGYGICAATMTNTCSGDGGEIDRALCVNLSTPPCSCLMPRTPSPTTLERFGFIVPRSDCVQYAATFGEEIECIDIP